MQLSLNSKTAVLNIWKLNDWIHRLLQSGSLFWNGSQSTLHFIYACVTGTAMGGVACRLEHVRLQDTHRGRAKMPFLSLFRLLSTLTLLPQLPNGMCSEPGPLSPSYPAFPKVLCCYSPKSIWWLNLSNRTFCFFFLRPGSMGVAPLQHKRRLILSFSPTRWIQHGKEVFFYLRLGLEAVTSAQSDGISNTGSMSAWQGWLTSF